MHEVNLKYATKPPICLHAPCSLLDSCQVCTIKPVSLTPLKYWYGTEALKVQIGIPPQGDKDIFGL